MNTYIAHSSLVYKKNENSSHSCSPKSTLHIFPLGTGVLGKSHLYIFTYFIRVKVPKLTLTTAYNVRADLPNFELNLNHVSPFYLHLKKMDSKAI